MWKLPKERETFLDESWNTYSTGGPFWAADKEYDGMLVTLYEGGAMFFHTDDNIDCIVNTKQYYDDPDNLCCNGIGISNPDGSICLEDRYLHRFKESDLKEIATLGAKVAETM